MSQPIASAVVLAALAATSAIRFPHARARRANRVTADHGGAVDRALMALVAIAMVALPLVFVATDWLAFADYHFSATLAWCGAALLGPALWLFARSHRDLGRHWSPMLHLHASQELVACGVYARVRHPMYAALWLWSTAQALLIANAIAGPAALAAFALLYVVRVPREEAMMESRFGAAYRAYAARTDRLVPGVV